MSHKLLSNGRAIQDWHKAVLENDLVDLDDWVHKAIDGKINSSAKRFKEKWKDKLFASDSMKNMTMAEANEILKDPEKFVPMVCALKEYKCRKVRDKEQEQELAQKGK
jgi:hypothetical protein